MAARWMILCFLLALATSSLAATCPPSQPAACPQADCKCIDAGSFYFYKCGSLWCNAQCAGCHGSEEAMPPKAPGPIEIGFLEGFISDGADLTTCTSDLAGEVATLNQAVEQLKTAFKTLNVTGIEDAMEKLAEASNDAIPAAKAACNPLKADLEALVAAFKNIPHGPKAFIAHVLDNLVSDGEKIFDELAAGDKAYRIAKDPMAAGQKLGMAFRRMLLGEPNSPTPPTPPVPGCPEAIVEGLAIGFISELPQLMDCGKAVKSDLGDFKKAADDIAEGLLHKNFTAIAGAMYEIGDAIKEGQDKIPECKESVRTTEADIKAIIDGLKTLHGPKDLLQHMMGNLLDDGVKIFDELAAAADSRKSKHCMDAGRHVGMAFRKVLVGEAQPAAAVLVV